MYTNGVKVRNFGDKMAKAVYPGTFDPFSNGHLDIVKRASQIFDEVHILVSCNIKKHPTFTAEERVNLIKMVVKDEKIDVIDALIEVYNSFISPKIDDYNSSVYYENPNYIFECYKAKKML